MKTVANKPKGPQPGRPFLHASQFEIDDADWYIMQCAHELGLDPLETAQEIRGALERRAWAQPSQPQSSSQQQRVEISVTGSEEAIPWPPGRAGRIAKVLFDTSYSPIQEVAITASLALLAGICGRAYRTHTGKDLALYIILVAKSGVGKDALHEGIPMMLELSERPMARYFVRASDFASGEALHKALLREPGFLYLQGEFGKKLKRMANPTDSPMQSFRNIMLMTFGKRFLEGKEYSNPENSLSGVDWPSLSFVGETTPSTFLECLTPDMMADGFMSRFLVISYGGGKPLPNVANRTAALLPDDAAAWTALVEHAIDYQFPINMPVAKSVQPDAAAKTILEQYEIGCIEKLNATDDETERQVWSRAHIKVLKVSALLAVIDHYLKPVVSVEHVGWAIELIQRDVETFQSRQRSGDIGVDDDARERKLLSFLREYVTAITLPQSYKVLPQMHQDGIVPRSYLQVRSVSLPAFSNHKLGTKRALEEAIGSLIANGHLMEVKPAKVVEDYNFHGKAYRILNVG